jgi:hypothetical protein
MIFRYRVHDVELPFRFQIDSKDTVEEFHITIEITAITGQGTYAKNVSLCSKDIITSSLTIAKKIINCHFQRKMDKSESNKQFCTFFNLCLFLCS